MAGDLAPQTDTHNFPTEQLSSPALRERATPNLPTNIIPTNIAWLKPSGKSPMDMRIPPLRIKIMLESYPLKPTMLVGGLGVSRSSQNRTQAGC